MLAGSLKEAKTPVNLDSKIPIHGMNVDVFKMIIEWIYTLNIKTLNDPFSPSLIVDLERLHIAADMYLLTDLCDSIGECLKYLLNNHNFGDMYHIVTRRVPGEGRASILDFQI
jgi:hypothetical protein